MALQTDVQWKAFFHALGIIDETVKTTYANAFVAGSITEVTLPHLDKATLTELGVDVIGHRLLIMNHIKTLSNETTSTKATVNAQLTTLTSEMTQAQYRHFENDWRACKQLLRLQPQQVVPYLYNACDQTVRNTITNAHPDFLNKTEEEALKTIKQIVTHKINPAVHRKTFTSLIQGDQSIQQFVVKLRSAAVECSYQCPNPACQYDLSETNIRDQLIAGLANSILQTEILAKADQLQTLDAVITHAEAFETACRAQNALTNDTDNNNIYGIHGEGRNFNENPQNNRGNNRRNRRRNNNNNNQRTNRDEVPSNRNRSEQYRSDNNPELHHDGPTRGHKPCSGCGSTEHGAPGSNNRSTLCPAWGHDCLGCGKPNHFAEVCRDRVETVRSFSLVSLVKSTADDDDNSVYDVQSTNSKEGMISADIKVGHINARKRPTKTMDIYPDSGADITLGGTKHLEELGYTVAQLIPTKKRIKVVGGGTLPCLGWLMAEFTIDGMFTTRQPLYIVEGVQRIFFSKTAMIATNILSPWYPHPMPPHTFTSNNVNASKQSSLCHLSDQPLTTGDRRLPPKRPAKIPYAATEENIPALKQFLLQQFRDSAFDTTAPFPVLNAKPGHIFLNPDAIPHARHTFIPVPQHWKKR